MGLKIWFPASSQVGIASDAGLCYMLIALYQSMTPLHVSVRIFLAFRYSFFFIYLAHECNLSPRFSIIMMILLSCICLFLQIFPPSTLNLALWQTRCSLSLLLSSNLKLSFKGYCLSGSGPSSFCPNLRWFCCSISSRFNCFTEDA